MKKKILAAAAIITLSLGGYHLANARPGGWGPGYGQGPCNNYNGQEQLTEEELKTREQFFEDNSELRKKMVIKQTELAAVMNSETPDEQKAAVISGELFDLRNEMHKKAQESGIKRGYGQNGNAPCGGPGMGMGMGMGPGGGPRHGGGW
jgi:zinc resistance-associated protein